MRDDDPWPELYLSVITALVVALVLVVWWSRCQ